MHVVTRPTPQPVAARLRILRKSQADLARQTGFSENWISRVVNGYEEPSRRMRAAIALALNEPEEELFR